MLDKLVNRIFIDMDGVLANFVKGIEKAHGDIIGLDIIVKTGWLNAK
jgi:hypothetical protein